MIDTTHKLLLLSTGLNFTANKKYCFYSTWEVRKYGNIPTNIMLIEYIIYLLSAFILTVFLKVQLNSVIKIIIIITIITIIIIINLWYCSCHSNIKFISSGHIPCNILYICLKNEETILRSEKWMAKLKPYLQGC